MPNIKRQDWLCLQRTVRFGDTDAAGVIHFYNLMRWCHEAWEDSINQYGLKAVDIFPSVAYKVPLLTTALPIVHCEVDFYAPLVLGDELVVELFPFKLDDRSFEIKYKFLRGKQENVAVALIRHFAINAKSRKRCELPEGIDRWLEASSVNQVITSL